ncbi:uncharacterized protein LOC110617355 [Manihot esculenta]|uniref:Uncharacterized protein n=1 Tax=Manihot esculenta TaxID=3983 RepID=A0A2C9VRE8_MANES|nr:uncharacterized protein LOC110617355 [Manihot esculenta]OAY48445.1 hypothetical protein MANES_06G159300v8 [Manihot esculenta]
MGGEQLMRRIPRIKFPQRHAKSSPSGSISDSHAMSRSDVPAPPSNAAVGGKASLQPKRTPVSEREIEAILLGGCF